MEASPRHLLQNRVGCREKQRLDKPLLLKTVKAGEVITGARTEARAVSAYERCHEWQLIQAWGFTEGPLWI